MAYSSTCPTSRTAHIRTNAFPDQAPSPKDAVTTHCTLSELALLPSAVNFASHKDTWLAQALYRKLAAYRKGDKSQSSAFLPSPTAFNFLQPPLFHTRAQHLAVEKSILLHQGLTNILPLIPMHFGMPCTYSVGKNIDWQHHDGIPMTRDLNYKEKN